ncbi:MAG: OmpA family protein [Deltaproteobacteria bacterium]|nr:OmpA family protein [Deltaproteobacteria bacterium]
MRTNPRFTEEESPSPLQDATWLYSYADMITQLLLFIILTVSVVGLKAMDQVSQEDEQVNEAVEEFEDLIAKQGLDDQLDIDRAAGRLVIRLRSYLLFGEGKADLGPDAAAVLDGVVVLLRHTDRHIRVEGHTDNVPIKSARFPSNWELSTERALSVIEYFEKAGIARDRLSVAGYGEFHPIMPNDTKAHRTLNRRVEIALLEAKQEAGE